MIQARAYLVRLLSTALAAGLVLVAPPVAAEPASSAGGPAASADWKADLIESFDSLSTSRWNVRNNTYSSTDLSQVMAANTTVSDGVLRVEAKRQPAGSRQYTSGALDTRGKYTLPEYFRVEVRAKTPWTPGLKASPIWLRPADGSAGEISFAETLGRESATPRVHHTVHSAYGTGHEVKRTSAEFGKVTDVAASDWHVYTVEKRPGQIITWADGTQTARFTSDSAPWFDDVYESGKRWNLRSNLMVGGSWPGNPTQSGDWSGDRSTMQVDYVHTWIPARDLAQPTPTPDPAPVPPPSGWTLDMHDDFNSLDDSRWHVKDRTYASNEDSYLLARNTSVANGVLRIQGRKESQNGRKYTSGYVQTNGKYSLPQYFRAEVRAKVPFEQGLWAAPLWFRPDDSGAGEIDLIETYGKERARPMIHQTIHTEYGSTHQQKVFALPYSKVSSKDATDWHTYTVEKTPGKIVMWVDGTKTAEFTSGNPGWFDRIMETGSRWNLRVNMQIGGSWGGLPDSTTDWSPERSAMQLDYIKTWVPAK